jgi:hypothetical protein
VEEIRMTVTGPDGVSQAVTDEVTAFQYYQCDSGTFSKMEYSGPVPPPIPDGCHEVTEAEYNADYAAWQASVEAHNAEMRRQDEERVLNNFTGLVNAGVPVDVARNLTGYQGPWPV